MRSRDLLELSRARDDRRLDERRRLAPGGGEGLLAHQVLAHGLVAQLEQRGACECRGRLELLVRVRAGVEVDARDPCVPAALAAVVAPHLLDEAVLCEGPQVIAARRGALAHLRRAFGGRGVAVELQPGEDPQARRVTERPERLGRGEAGMGRCERDISKIPFHSSTVNAHARTSSSGQTPTVCAGLVEQHANLARQVLGAEGLLQEGDAGLEHAVMDDRRIGVPGHVEHVRPGPHRRHGVRDFGAAHPRHDDVGEQQVDRVAVPAKQLERRRAVTRLQDGIARRLEDLRHELPHDGFVLDEQDRLVAALGGGRRARRIRRRRRRGRLREADAERRAHARSRCRPRSSRRSARRRRRRSRARARCRPAFVVKNGSKSCERSVVGHPDAGVGHSQLDCGAGFRSRCSPSRSSASRRAAWRPAR